MYSKMLDINHHIWASTRENLSRGACKQQRRRPAYAFAQSDQRLSYWLLNRFATSEKFNFLASLCSLASWFESHFVGNPKDRFCLDETQISIYIPINQPTLIKESK